MQAIPNVPSAAQPWAGFAGESELAADAQSYEAPSQRSKRFVQTQNIERQVASTVWVLQLAREQLVPLQTHAPLAVQALMVVP